MAHTLHTGGLAWAGRAFFRAAAWQVEQAGLGVLALAWLAGRAVQPVRRARWAVVQVAAVVGVPAARRAVQQRRRARQQLHALWVACGRPAEFAPRVSLAERVCGWLLWLLESEREAARREWRAVQREQRRGRR